MVLLIILHTGVGWTNDTVDLTLQARMLHERFAGTWSSLLGVADTCVDTHDLLCSSQMFRLELTCRAEPVIISPPLPACRLSITTRMHLANTFRAITCMHLTFSLELHLMPLASRAGSRPDSRLCMAQVAWCLL